MENLESIITDVDERQYIDRVKIWHKDINRQYGLKKDRRNIEEARARLERMNKAECGSRSNCDSFRITPRPPHPSRKDHTNPRKCVHPDRSEKEITKIEQARKDWGEGLEVGLPLCEL
jgi:hypothetical protein